MRMPMRSTPRPKLEKNSAYRQVVEDGLRANEEHNKLTDPVEAHDWMHGTLERSQNHINSKLNSGAGWSGVLLWVGMLILALAAIATVVLVAGR